MLKFQAEAFFFHLVVAFRIKLVEKCYFLVGHWERFVKLGQNAQFQQPSFSILLQKLRLSNFTLRIAS